MARRKAVCVTGMPGSGKEGFLDVAQEMGLPVVRMGDVVREEAARRGLDGTDVSVGTMADAERRKHGPAVWARRTLERIDADAVVIDGLRSRAELKAFRDGFDEVVVVAVHASPRTRHTRMTLRGREDDDLDTAGFQVRDQRELAWGLGEVIALADRMIVNEGSYEAFQGEARRVLERAFG